MNRQLNENIDKGEERKSFGKTTATRALSTGGYSGLERYRKLREDGSKVLGELNQKNEEFDEKVRATIKQMREEFEKEIAPIQKEYDGIESQISLTQEEALKKLNDRENEIIASDISGPQKVKAIEELRKSFLQVFNPDDNYLRYVKIYCLRKLREAFTEMFTQSGEGLLKAGSGGVAVLSIGMGPDPRLLGERTDERQMSGNGFHRMVTGNHQSFNKRPFENKLRNANVEKTGMIRSHPPKAAFVEEIDD